MRLLLPLSERRREVGENIVAGHLIFISVLCFVFVGLDRLDRNEAGMARTGGHDRYRYRSISERGQTIAGVGDDLAFRFHSFISRLYLIITMHITSDQRMHTNNSTNRIILSRHHHQQPTKMYRQLVFNFIRHCGGGGSGANQNINKTS